MKTLSLLSLAGLLALATTTLGAATPKVIPVGPRPESVTRGFGGHYYLTVMGEPQSGDGVIKVLKGEQLEVFATGLDEPKGIAFVGDSLVTADLKRVWQIDAQGRKTVLADASAFPHPPSFLNDVAAAPNGRSVYVTDTGATDKMMNAEGLWPLDSAEAKALPAIGRVYQVSLDGQVRTVVDADRLMACPNGVCVLGRNRLLIAEFFYGHILEARGARLRMRHTGLRGADAIERDKQGRLYVSSWTQGKVWRIEKNGGAPTVLLEGLQSAADFYLDEAAGQLLVPDMKAGTLTLLPLKP